MNEDHHGMIYLFLCKKPLVSKESEKENEDFDMFDFLDGLDDVSTNKAPAGQSQEAKSWFSQSDELVSSNQLKRITTLPDVDQIDWSDFNFLFYILKTYLLQIPPIKMCVLSYFIVVPSASNNSRLN